jgi:hypothetical protein
MSGPNDFHGEIIDGKWVAMPGLGDYEPTDAVKVAQDAREAAIAERERVLAAKESALAAMTTAARK